MQTTDFIWFDGKMVPWADAQVHVLTHALHYGSAVFEGIRAYACADGTSAVFRLKEHSQRLLNSAKILRLNIPYTVDEISQGILDTLKANKMKEGYIRPLSFVGDGEMGVYPGNNKVHTIIAVWPWGAYLGPEALEMGIRAKTSSFARMHVNTLMSKAKAAGNYVNSILGGITRDSVMKVARDLGYTVEEQQFTRDELYIADEAFFTGTAAEITPIREVDNRTIGAGHAVPERIPRFFAQDASGLRADF